MKPTHEHSKPAIGSMLASVIFMSQMLAAAFSAMISAGTSLSLTFLTLLMMFITVEAWMGKTWGFIGG